MMRPGAWEKSFKKRMRRARRLQGRIRGIRSAAQLGAPPGRGAARGQGGAGAGSLGSFEEHSVEPSGVCLDEWELFPCSSLDDASVSVSNDAEQRMLSWRQSVLDRLLQRDLVQVQLCQSRRLSSVPRKSFCLSFSRHLNPEFSRQETFHSSHDTSDDLFSMIVCVDLLSDWRPQSISIVACC